MACISIFDFSIAANAVNVTPKPLPMRFVRDE